jgi:MFS family permease
VPAAISLLGGFGAAGAVIGQVCGGLVTDAAGYHWIFWISVITGALAAAGVLAFVPESSLTSPGRVDLVGALLLAAGLGAPLLAVSKTPTEGWLGLRTLALFGAGLAFLAAFVRHERRHPDPILHLPTLLRPQVRLANLATMLVGFGLFGTSAIISQFVQMPRSTGYGLGASATAAGLFFVPGLGLMLVGSSAIGRLISTAGPRVGLVIGAALGSVALVALTLSHGSTIDLFIWPTLMYVGVGFAFSAAPLLILEVVPAELRGQSTAVNLIMRNIGTSVGLQVAATIVTASAHGGLPTEGGYTTAFALEACAACGAVVLALTIPRRARPPRPAVLEPAVEASALVSERV